jgi:hypothetical protein
MSDDVARAVASGSPDGLTINGKPCSARPLSIREIGEIERDCLQQYRRRYLQAFADNVDLLPGGDDLLLQKAEECARWDVDILPKKFVYDMSGIVITPKLKQWLVNNVGEDADKYNKRALEKIVLNCLDKEALKPEQVKAMTGKTPRKIATGYVNWWITAEAEGMVSMIYHCVKHGGITKEDVIEQFSNKDAQLAMLSRDIESMSTPQVGNGQG